MRRSTALRLSIAGLALAPMMTACTVSFGTGSDAESSTAAAPATTEAPAETTEATPTGTATEAETTSPEPPDTATASEPAQTSEPATTSAPASAASTSGTASAGGKTQRVDVPAGQGIQKLELIDLYGGDTSSGTYGEGVGVFTVTNDRPVMLNLEIKLFDAAGKEIASNEGLNSLYTVGEHHLVTTNLIELPKGATPKTFKVRLLEVTDMSKTAKATITSLATPTVGSFTKVSGTKALKGTATFTGSLGNSLDAKGACIMPDGRIFSGSESLVDNTVRQSGGSSMIDYEIPLYEAKDVDLSKATCYTSA